MTADRRRSSGRDLSQVQSMACHCGPPPEACIAGEAELTHHAWRAGAFRHEPRYADGERAMSVLMGHLTAEQATRDRLEATGAEPTPSPLRLAVVRHTTAEKLRDQGFAVIHTPGRVVRGIHASVVWPDDDPLVNQVIPWPPGVPALFDSCFNE